MAPPGPALDPTACAGSARPGQASGKPAFVFRTVLWIRIRMFLGLLDPTACAGSARPGQASGKPLLLCSVQSSGSGSVCFWASWIWIRHYFVRIRILLSTSKTSKKDPDFY